MLHQVFGRKLNRTSNERKRLFRNLTRSLILYGRITTTLAKAKAIQPLVEKLVTRAKNNTLHNRRILLKEIVDRMVVDKLLKVVGPAFKNTHGGYTRIIKIKSSKGDNRTQAIISFTQEFVQEKKEVKEKPKEKETNAKNTPNKKK